MLFWRQAVLVLCCSIFFSGPCWAKDPSTLAPEPPIYQPFKKLSRGIVNAVTAPLEVPNQIYWQARKGKNEPGRIISGYVEGVFIGTGWTIARFLVGSYDIITFPIPPYKKSLIQPEYLFDSYREEYKELFDW